MSDEQRPLPQLSRDDQRLLDELVDHGFDVESMELSTADRSRANALCSLFGLLSDYPVDDGDPALVDATLARIDRAEHDRSMRLSLDPETAGSGAGFRIRVPDFVTVAAVLLIVASIALPTMRHLRNQSMDASCANNMRAIGYAFGNYAADYQGRLPMAQAGLNGTWSRFFSNQINLAPLEDYCDMGHHGCPGHRGQGSGSYAYIWQVPGQRAQLDTEHQTVLLADRNPIIDALLARDLPSPLAPSLNHGGRGQNALRSDGSIEWLEQPLVGTGDNIWLPKGIEMLYDGAKPSQPGDVFLAQ